MVRLSCTGIFFTSTFGELAIFCAQNFSTLDKLCACLLYPHLLRLLHVDYYQLFCPKGRLQH